MSRNFSFRYLASLCGGLSLEEYHNLLPSMSDYGAQDSESSIFHVELPVVPREKAVLPASLGAWVSIHLLMARQRAIPKTKWLLLSSSVISASCRILLSFSEISQVFWTVCLNRESSASRDFEISPSFHCGQASKADSSFDFRKSCTGQE